MKKMRRIAVMLSAMMTFSAIGGMSASAVELTTDTNGGLTAVDEHDNQKQAGIGLNIYGTTIPATVTPTEAVWKIEVSTQNLTWHVTRTKRPATLTWTGTNYEYNVSDEENGEWSLNTEETNNNVKTVTLTNKCNFDVAVNATIADVGEYSLFSADIAYEDTINNKMGKYDSVATTDSATLTVTPNKTNIETYLNNVSNNINLSENSETPTFITSAVLTFTGDTSNLYPYVAP